MARPTSPIIMSNTIASLLSPIQTTQVEAALQQTFKTTAVSDISLLTGGLSGSSVYKIIVNEQSYVLKIDASITKNTIENFRLASKAGIAPHVYYQDAENGLSIFDYIEGKPLRAVFTPEKLILELAYSIKTVHAVPCVRAGNNLLENIEGMINAFQQSGMLSGPVFEECFTYYGQIKDQYPWEDTDKVFSHNDLNPNNLLCDGEKVWIIDWDVAFLNDRYVDLANAANFFIHTEEQEKAFLNAYFEELVDEYKTARFYVMRQVCRIIYSMMMFQLARQAKPADHDHNHDMEGISLKEFGALMAAGKLSLAGYDGQFMFGKALLNEAVTQMRSLRFTESIAQLSARHQK